MNYMKNLEQLGFLEQSVNEMKRKNLATTPATTMHSTMKCGQDACEFTEITPLVFRQNFIICG